MVEEASRRNRNLPSLKRPHVDDVSTERSILQDSCPVRVYHPRPPAARTMSRRSSMEREIWFHKHEHPKHDRKRIRIVELGSHCLFSSKCESGNLQYRLHGCTKFEWVPYNEAHGHTGSDVCKSRLLPVVVIKRGCRRGKKKASTRQAAKRRGGERSAITHWSCDPEPERLLH